MTCCFHSHWQTPFRQSLRASGYAQTWEAHVCYYDSKWLFCAGLSIQKKQRLSLPWHVSRKLKNPQNCKGISIASRWSTLKEDHIGKAKIIYFPIALCYSWSARLQTIVCETVPPDLKNVKIRPKFDRGFCNWSYTSNRMLSTWRINQSVPKLIRAVDLQD